MIPVLSPLSKLRSRFDCLIETREQVELLEYQRNWIKLSFRLQFCCLRCQYIDWKIVREDNASIISQIARRTRLSQGEDIFVKENRPHFCSFLMFTQHKNQHNSQRDLIPYQIHLISSISVCIVTHYKRSFN